MDSTKNDIACQPPSDRPDNTIVGHVRNGFLARMMHYSPPAVVVWLALANRADGDGCCFPSITTLQKDTGLARATIYKALDELVKAGEISVTPGRGKGNPSNHYQIEGGPGNELVQSANQFNLRTKVVHSTDKVVRRMNSNHTQEPNAVTRRGKTRARFVKPSVEEVTAYCRERENNIDPQHFVDRNESIGWVVGKARTPMKDWKAAIRTWERNGFSNGKPEQPKKEIVYRDIHK